MDMQKPAKLAEMLSKAHRAVFFGGAGVSTESGIPDFRSKDGLYNRRDVRFEAYSPEYLLSHSCLTDRPEVFFEFYRQKLDTRKIMPNAAHFFLAELEKAGKLKAVVTQNIDGLHQKAGSREVYEIHGSTLRNYCMTCGKTYAPDYLFESSDPVPRCSCGGIVRCDVTLYEESLPEEAVEKAIGALRTADLLIIGGTSLTVYPAASFIRYFRGDTTVVINKERLSLPPGLGRVIEINAPIGQLFSDLAKRTGISLPG